MLINNNYNHNKTDIYLLYTDILVSEAMLYGRAEELIINLLC